MGALKQYIDKLKPREREPFYDGSFDNPEFRTTKHELDWRLQLLLQKNSLLADMFAHPKTAINIGREMDEGKVIIINNTYNPKVLGKEGSVFFSRIFMALILAAAYQRTDREDKDKLPCYVYIDEFHMSFKSDKNIAEIIHQCRSQNIGLIMAHQEFQQIKDEDVRGALTNCAVRLANSDDEAHELAPRFRTTAAHLGNLKIGQFALFIKDHLSQAITIQVPNDPIWKWPKMDDPDFERIAREQRLRYTSAVEAERVEEPPRTTFTGETIYEVRPEPHAEARPSEPRKPAGRALPSPDPIQPKPWRRKRS